MKSKKSGDISKKKKREKKIQIVLTILVFILTIALGIVIVTLVNKIDFNELAPQNSNVNTLYINEEQDTGEEDILMVELEGNNQGQNQNEEKPTNEGEGTRKTK